MIDKYLTNQERTEEYLKKFNRTSILKSLVKSESPIIFDVGANTGQSLREFKEIWPDSVVHCFEPQKECLENLEKSASMFKDVFVNNFAVGSKNKEEVFYTHDISTGISGFNKVNLESVDSIDRSKIISGDNQEFKNYQNKLNHSRQVLIKRLDEYLVNESITKIDFLKIDTQGFEPEVLSGLGERLGDVGVVLTELMFYDYYERSLSFSDIEQFLLPAGFKLFDISHIAKNPMNGRTDWVDVIYTNNKQLDAK